jgi:hypothetical protein
VLGRVAVADDQARPIVADARDPEAFQPLQGQAVPGGPGDELPLGVGPGQFEDRVQAGGDPADMASLAAQGGGQPIAATAVGEPGAADLPVVAAGSDELGQDELVQPRGARGQLGRHGVE